MVGDWFERFIVEHAIRHPQAGLPDPTSEAGVTFFGAWRTAFVHRGVHDFAVATEASELLAGEVLRHSSQHFPKLLELAIGLYKVRAAAGTVDAAPDSREAAERASRDCRHCHGDGLVVVYRPNPNPHGCRNCGGPIDPDAVCRGCNPGYPKVPASVAAYCVCTMGRWVEKNHREKSPDVHRRIPDFADVLAGRSGWAATPPRSQEEPPYEAEEAA